MIRRNRGEMRAMEARISNLIDALRTSGDPMQFDLACRLWRCQQQREERRVGLRDRVDRPCRSVACEHCRRWRGQEWRERAAEQMRHADNECSSMVTIMLERTGDFSAVRDVVLSFRTALRNLRDRKARQDTRWRKLGVIGLAELDMLAVDDIPFLPPLRRAVIAALPVRSHAEDFTVAVHVHLAVSHPMIPRHSLEHAFQQQWQGAGRVDVREFRDAMSAPENAGGIIAYASKFEMKTVFHGNMEFPTPVAWQARMWGWLHSLRCGLAPLRVRMSAMSDPESDYSDDAKPIPVLIDKSKSNAPHITEGKEKTDDSLINPPSDMLIGLVTLSPYLPVLVGSVDNSVCVLPTAQPIVP